MFVSLSNCLKTFFLSFCLLVIFHISKFTFVSLFLSFCLSISVEKTSFLAFFYIFQSWLGLFLISFYVSMTLCFNSTFVKTSDFQIFFCFCISASVFLFHLRYFFSGLFILHFSKLTIFYLLYFTKLRHHTFWLFAYLLIFHIPGLYLNSSFPLFFKPILKESVSWENYCERQTDRQKYVGNEFLCDRSRIFQHQIFILQIWTEVECFFLNCFFF